jgi:glycosyltransferase involved in cell wall biosynthesis
MPRYSRMVLEGMEERGHKVEVWTAEPRFYKINVGNSLKKWLGYIDQHVLFPLLIRRKIKRTSKDTLFVFADNALGPWVPLVTHRHHVIHCHDFMAQLSAIGSVPQNQTGWSGRQYQAFIRRGYSKGKNFISVSEKTRQDLHKFLLKPPLTSEVVYNGLNRKMQVHERTCARNLFERRAGVEVSRGFILHVGGNLWYKNRAGVIAIYNQWRTKHGSELPLILIGEQPDNTLLSVFANSPFKKNIHFLTDAPDDLVQIAYSGATVLLFPSFKEGFGWPIVEAMACSCPVITTNEAPMTEVGGDAAFFISRLNKEEELINWAHEGALMVETVVRLPEQERCEVVNKGLMNVKRFDPNTCLNNIEAIYKDILKNSH